MDNDKVDYILRFYNLLISQADKRTLNKYHYYHNYLMLKSDAPAEDLAKYDEKKRMARYGLTALQISQYAQKDITTVRKEIALRVFELHQHTIAFNLCPICGALARTPVARQAKCGHRW